MSKPSRSGPRYGGSKKKPKKRSDLQSVAQIPSSDTQQPVQPRTEAVVGTKPSGGVLQFRPRAREISAARPAAVRASARAFQQVVDYSYVYTDLKIIGGLSAALFGGLVALSFIIR